MISPVDFFNDLTNPVLAFLPRALLVAVTCSLLCAVMGCHVVLRGMAFVGDAVAHAVFPGLAIAFLIQGSLLIGGLIAGLVTAVAAAVFSQRGRVKHDAVIGVFFVSAFAMGIVIISRVPGYTGSLSEMLFGSMTGIPSSEVKVVVGAAVLIGAVAALFHHQLVAVSLDRESAQASGLRVLWLDIVLYVLVTLCVVLSVRMVGNILVLAFLLTPAASARLLTDSLPRMMAWAAGLGASASVLGIYLSWSLDLPAGGTIVLVSSVLFLLVWVCAPRHGLLARVVNRRIVPQPQ